MEKRIIAYAITHAPRGQKGGPYEASCEHMHVRYTTRDLAEAQKSLALVRRSRPTARVIRIVRKARPSEASAVQVLRELVAWDSAPTSAGLEFGPIVDRAHRVLAASGPDPMPVVRAAMRYLDHGPDGRLGPLWVGFREAGEAYREAVDAYRKAGGTP